VNNPHARIGKLMALAAVIGLLLLACTPPGTGPSAVAGKPWVTIAAPASGSQLLVGQETIIQINATDAQGITRVEIKVDSALIGTAQSPTAQGQTALTALQRWTFVQAGSHVIMAQAYNVAGQASDPAVINVRVVPGGGTPLPQPTTAPGEPTTVPPTAPPPMPTPPGCVDNSEFVMDVTVPDDSVFQPGDRMDKIWRIKNIGSCTWGSGYRWAFVKGSRMGSPESVAVPYTEPGQTADLQVIFTAPSAPGTYTTYWRLRDPNGNLVGHQTMMRIIVPPPPTAPPPPTVPPPPTPMPDINFWADDTTLHPGQCTWVRWNVDYVLAVYFAVWDGSPEQGVAGHDQRWVCPSVTTLYRLRIVTPSGDQFRYVTLFVSPYY